MISEGMGYELAAVAIGSVLLVSLFPSAAGPYSAVHGPVTALRSAQAATSLRSVIVASAVSIPFTLRANFRLGAGLDRKVRERRVDLRSPERSSMRRC